MFDSLDDVALLATMRRAQREERVAVAARWFAAGQLCRRRMAAAEEVDRTQWCIDNWEEAAAEVAAELGVSRGRASSQMHYGVELIERLPALGAVFAAGEVDVRVITVAVFRTGLITDAAVLADIDARLAVRAPLWNSYSRARTADLVDWLVRDLDPAAVRTARDNDLDRHIEVGPGRDGLAELWGSVRAPDAAAVDRRLDQLAATVCRQDSRTRRQRRADALAALAAGRTSMGCDCGSADCPAADSDAQPGQIVIHLLAEEATISGAGASPGYLPGYGAVPAETIRDLARRARVRPLARAHQLSAEPQYRPSTALAAFIRARDLCCRFPGCDKAAEFCDIDHTVPYRLGGPTHPSNLALLCRCHHLLKTFWTGETGWREQQFSDATIIWTSPTGRTYTTTPGGALFFPQFFSHKATPTENLTITTHPPDPPTGRTLMMPTRRRTRTADRAARITVERNLNEARMNADPPPF